MLGARLQMLLLELRCRGILMRAYHAISAWVLHAHLGFPAGKGHRRSRRVVNPLHPRWESP